MPLEKGDNPTAIGHNIKKEEEAGKPKAQAVAIALHTAKDAFINKTHPTSISAQEVLERNKEYWKQYSCPPPGMGGEDFE